MKTKALTDWRKLESVCLEGICPGCDNETVSAIEYPSDNEIWFECCNCDWDATYSLSDAREAGYYPEGELDN